MQLEQRGAPLQRGALVRHAGGCLSPRVLDFLCFDTPRSVLGSEEGEEELPFYLADQASLEDHVRQGLLPCPALWVERSAAAAGSAPLLVLYRLGGAVQHCALPGKPIKLQPVKAGGGGGGGSARQGAAACRSFVSSRRHMQLYRLVLSLFPKLQQLDADLAGGAVALRGAGPAAAAGWAAPGLLADTATPVLQGVLLERLDEGGEPRQLTVAPDFAHACLVLLQAPGPGPTPDCLRTVNCLSEALAVLHRDTGCLGPPSLTASPVKPGGGIKRGGGAPPPTPFQSPSKPPLPAAHGAEALRLAVALVQECGSGRLREGLAILSASAGSPQLCAAALGLGAMEALVTAAATVLPTASMGMAELQPSIAVAVAGLLDAAPAAAAAPARLVAILAAVLRQSCASPLLLCRLLVALLARPDVRAEAMRQGLAGSIAAMYARASPMAVAAADALAGAGGSSSQLVSGGGGQAPAAQPGPLGFGSPLQGQAAGGEQPFGSAGSGRHGQVSHLVAAYNALSDSGSDCSPSASRSASPVKGSPMRSPSALSSGRFSVPRLALPACDSPTGAGPGGGLTRSTRRVLSGTPGGARSPSPYASPSRRAGTCDGGGEPAAAAELATLASALGESLMAADLPAIVAHKRLADARLGEAEEEDGVPAELLEAPVPGGTGTAPATGGKKVLEAHRILVTARSLRSVDSSAGRTSDADSAAAAEGVAARSARLAVDVEQVKCLLLRALAAALPLVEAEGWPPRDPSPMLAAEVVGLLGRPLSPTQEQLKSLALQALLRLSQRPTAAAAAAGGRRLGSSPASAAAGGGGRHVLVAVAGRRLEALTGGGPAEGEARGELLALLQLLTDYTTAVQEPTVAEAVVRHCLTSLQSLMGVLQAAGVDAAGWAPPTWQLLHALVLLLAAACKKCEEAEAGRGLLALLLGDQQAAAMLAGAAGHVLLLPEPAAAGAGASLAQRRRAAALQRDLLQLFAALAALVGRQPPCVRQPHHPREADRAASRLSAASSALDSGRDAHQDPGQDLLLGLSARRGLTRRNALLFFGVLVSPHSGLAQRILDHEPYPAAGAAPGAAAAPGKGAAGPQLPPSACGPGGGPGMPASSIVRLRQSLLELLKAAFAAPGSPFAADKFVSDFYIRFHFVQFLKLYHNPQRDHQALFLCRQHMDTLLTLAGDSSPHIRHRFLQLSVVDFFVRELSLEFEAKQPARGRMHRLSSSGSQLDHRRTSSSSTLAGLESGNASPVPSLRLPTVHEPQPAARPPGDWRYRA